jgi:hypothetical protein
MRRTVSLLTERAQGSGQSGDMAARVGTLLAIATLLLAGCSGGTGAHPSAGGTLLAGEGGARENVPSALDNLRDARFPAPLIDLDHLVSGGPPPDGIPPIDAPNFQPADAVDWLEASEPVLALTVAGETRAYPLQVMTWHEIVNDTVGGVPVAVTYCPLCNSGVAFLRRVGERLLDFGTSGMLYADNLVMYDRQTESLWPQLTGQASVGALTGTQLTAVPMGVVGWGQFRTAHPDSLVLTRDTGYDRPYGRNPYVGYDDPNGGLLVEPPGGRDPRLPVKARVIGIRVGDHALAIRRDEVVDAGVLTVTLAGQDILVWHTPGQRSALDADAIADSRDIGTVGVFDPRMGNRTLTFSPVGGGFRDQQTGSAWNVLGESTGGPLKGSRLEPLIHVDTFWFAWEAFQPATALNP